MNLLEELTGNAYRVERRARGIRVTFALDGEEAEELRLEREGGVVNPYGTRHMVNGIPKRELVLVALREGRAIHEADIPRVTGLSHATTIKTLHKLRREGEVEFHHVGNFRLWSRPQTRTTPADDPDCIRAVAHVRSPAHTTGEAA